LFIFLNFIFYYFGPLPDHHHLLVFYAIAVRFGLPPFAAVLLAA
jgi:hypothetical protein